MRRKEQIQTDGGERHTSSSFLRALVEEEEEEVEEVEVVVLLVVFLDMAFCKRKKTENKE
jgi:hypothetical protein